MISIEALYTCSSFLDTCYFSSFEHYFHTIMVVSSNDFWFCFLFKHFTSYLNFHSFWKIEHKNCDANSFLVFRDKDSLSDFSQLRANSLVVTLTVLNDLKSCIDTDSKHANPMLSFYSARVFCHNIISSAIKNT